MKVRRLARFALTGILNTLVHAGVVAFVYQNMLANGVVANGVAFCLATLGSYQINCRWTFVAARSPRRFRRFFWVSLLGLMLTLLISALAQPLGLTVVQGTLLVIGSLPPITYLLHRHWTFDDRQPAVPNRPPFFRLPSRSGALDAPQNPNETLSTPDLGLRSTPARVIPAIARFRSGEDACGDP